jgi:predicted ATP-grasp superfamily ATP-dependent carboligase
MPPEKKYFVSLGAGRNQIPLIRAARELGYPVIAVDRNPAAPGFEFADIRLFCSIRKPYTIMRKIREGLIIDSIAGVASRSFGAANMSASIIAEGFRIPSIPKETLRLFRNKRRLKRFLSNQGVPIPRTHSWKTQKQRAALLSAKAPLIVRPAIGSHGKIGLGILSTRDRIEAFLEKNSPDTEKFLIEEYVEGMEITALGYAENGVYRNVIFSDKIVSRKPPLFAELAHRFPSHAGPEDLAEIEATLQRIITALGITSGPLISEFIIPSKKRSKPLLVECAPETGGEYIADCIAPASINYNFFSKLVNLSLNINDSEDPYTPNMAPGKSVIVRFIPQRDGILEEIRFPPGLLNHPGHLFSRLLKSPGDATSVTRGNLDRLAVFALEAPIEGAAELEIDVESIVGETVVQYARPGEKR